MYASSNRLQNSDSFLLKGEIDKSIIIFGDFNTLLSVIDKTCRQKNQQVFRRPEHNYQIDIYRTLHPITTYSFQVYMDQLPYYELYNKT